MQRLSTRLAGEGREGERGKERGKEREGRREREGEREGRREREGERGKEREGKERKPVFAMPIISLPERATGMACF